MKRDPQSPETLTRTLEPRKISLPCGRVHGGGQTSTFVFSTDQTIQLLWNFGGAPVTYHVIRVVEVNQNGPDRIVADALVFAYETTAFRPVLSHKLHIHFLGSPHLLMTWFFATTQDFSVTFFSRALKMSGRMDEK